MKIVKYISLVIALVFITTKIAYASSSTIQFTVEESTVCNIYYKMPEEIKDSTTLILKDLNGNIIAELEVDEDSDEIFFPNVPFGKYYIEAVDSNLKGNCLPVVLDKSSLDDAHIKKDLNIEDNFFTDDQSKVISDFGYSGTEVTQDILDNVKKVLGGNSDRYPNKMYPSKSKSKSKNNKSDNYLDIDDLNNTDNSGDHENSYNVDNNSDDNSDDNSFTDDQSKVISNSDDSVTDSSKNILNSIKNILKGTNDKPNNNKYTSIVNNTESNNYSDKSDSTNVDNNSDDNLVSYIVKVVKLSKDTLVNDTLVNLYKYIVFFLILLLISFLILFFKSRDDKEDENKEVI